MHTGLRCVPIDHPRVHCHPDPLACLAELKGEVLTAHDDGETMAGIGMPRHCFSGLEDEPTNHEVVAPGNDFCLHGVVPTSFGLPNAGLSGRRYRCSDGTRDPFCRSAPAVCSALRLNGEKPPSASDTLQGMRPTIRETKPRSRDKILHRSPPN